MLPIHVVRAALLVPALASSVWIVKNPPVQKPASPFVKVAVDNDTPTAHVMQHPLSLKKVSDRGSDDALIERRLRVEGLLTTLDRVAEVAMQMKPEEADRLEPAIVDLAERTLELVDARTLADPSSDRELDDIERTVKGLVSTLNRYVETEVKL